MTLETGSADTEEVTVTRRCGKRNACSQKRALTKNDGAKCDDRSF